MIPAADLIRREMGEGSLVEQAVFGTSDTEEIANVLAGLGRQAIDNPILEILFYRSSVGCVAGLRGENGQAVVVKAHQPTRDLNSLLAVAAVQEAVFEEGFPCPCAIAPPVLIGAGLGHATFELYLPDPGQSRITPKMLGVSAYGLARLASHTKSLASLGSALLAPAPPADGLYPLPHSPMFDFEATTEGAEWIDEIAAPALEIIKNDQSEPQVMHGDWSAANVRFTEQELLAVYDWDSLVFAPISRAVGVAAATWSAWGHTPEPTVPSASDVHDYVREFERAWAPLDEVQRQAAFANALYCLAYTARCEHSIDPEGQQSYSRARARLRSEGTDLLDR